MKEVDPTFLITAGVTDIDTTGIICSKAKMMHFACSFE